MPRKIRGTLTIKAEDDMEFRAQRSTGMSSQQEISRRGDSKIYRTVGEKKQRLVAHLSCAPDDPDPAGTFMEQLQQLTSTMNPKAPARLRGRTLQADDDLRVTLSKKEHRVEMVMSIDLSLYPNYQQQLMNLMYRTNQCFAINQTSLASARK